RRVQACEQCSHRRTETVSGDQQSVPLNVLEHRLKRDPALPERTRDPPVHFAALRPFGEPKLNVVAHIAGVLSVSSPKSNQCQPVILPPRQKAMDALAAHRSQALEEMTRRKIHTLQNLLNTVAVET